MTSRRKIVIVVDGTGCSASYGVRGNFSNAFRIASMIETIGNENEQQIVIYFPGPGTRNVPWKEVNKATGSETREIVLEAYLSLCCNSTLSPSDSIYLFGFSRGGVAAKALADILLHCGLLRKDSLHFLQEVWEFYINKPSLPAHQEPLFIDRVFFPSIEFVGLFDPVHGPVTKFLDLRLRKEFPTNVLNAVELFSIDEIRKDFLPHIWIDEGSKQLINTRPRSTLGGLSPRLQQIWIPGGHSDVGSLESKSLIADISLLTMIERASALTDLSFNKQNINDVIEHMGSPERRVVVFPGAKFWKKKRRSIPRDSVQLIHPIYDYLINRKIGKDKSKSKIYLSQIEIEQSNPRYSFDLSGLGVPGGTDINSKIRRCIGNALSGL